MPPDEFAKIVSGPEQSTLAKLLGVAVQEFSRTQKKDKFGNFIQSSEGVNKKVYWSVIENILDRAIGKPTLVKAEENNENATFTLNYSFKTKGSNNESKEQPETKSKSITTTGS